MERKSALPIQANMDDPGMDTNPNTTSKTGILPSTYDLRALKSNNPSFGQMATSIHGDVEPFQQRTFRSILPKPSESLESRMDINHGVIPDMGGVQIGSAAMPGVGRVHLDIMEQRPARIPAGISASIPASITEDETIQTRTRSEGSNPTPNPQPKNLKSVGPGKNNEHNNNSESDTNSDDTDFDDEDSHSGGPDLNASNTITSDPTTSDPVTSEPGSSAASKSHDKVRRADTTFTKTELIALGVAYAVEPSWPRIAGYFPHRTQRSLYQTFKHTFTHAGTGHKLARDSYPPGADIPEIRNKFQALRKLGSRTRRVVHDDLPKEYERDIIRGHLSLSRWQKNPTKSSVNSEQVPKEKSLAVREEHKQGSLKSPANVEEIPMQKSLTARKVHKQRSLTVREEEHMQALRDEWEEQDDESDFEDIRKASAVTIKQENVIIKTDPDQTNGPQLSLADIPESSIIDLDSPQISESSLNEIKSQLIEQISRCENPEELSQVLMNGLEIVEAKPGGSPVKRRPGRPMKRKRRVEEE
ncbi:hypothetical protein NHQ30_011393 [Ciborinia camelliae]|nr:hypothetical protein NHQ30_011393 [Ciborinia camelliae]